MNAVTTIWRQLVRNKLWPVAVLLLAALVAVPTLLAREPAVPEAITPVAVTTEADDSIAEPIVAKITPEDRDRRRRVLGVRKDPFKPAPVKKPKAVEQPDAPDQSQPNAPSTGGTEGGRRRRRARRGSRVLRARDDHRALRRRGRTPTSRASPSPSSARCPTTSSRCSCTWV